MIDYDPSDPNEYVVNFKQNITTDQSGSICLDSGVNITLSEFSMSKIIDGNNSIINSDNHVFNKLL